MSVGGIGANVFITGANRGIGLGLVGELAKVSGVKNIFAGCRDQNNAKHLKELEKSTNSVVKLVSIDVQNDENIKTAFNEVKKSLGSDGVINLFINNSGIFESEGVSIKNPERAAFAKHFDVNSIGAAVTTAAFLPLIIQAGASNQPAKVVNISSTIGSTTMVQDSKRVPYNNIIYGMSKAALNHYTKALAGDLKNSNVIAVTVCPGWVRTDMGAHADFHSSKEETTAKEFHDALLNFMVCLTQPFLLINSASFISLLDSFRSLVKKINLVLLFETVSGMQKSAANIRLLVESKLFVTTDEGSNVNAIGGTNNNNKTKKLEKLIGKIRQVEIIRSTAHQALKLPIQTRWLRYYNMVVALQENTHLLDSFSESYSLVSDLLAIARLCERIFRFIEANSRYGR